MCTRRLPPRDGRYGVNCLGRLCVILMRSSEKGEEKVESSSSGSKKPSHALGARSAIIKGNASGD